MYRFFVLGVDVRCPYRESGWKQTEIMLHCVLSLWFTWLCLISSVIKRKLAHVLCATAGGGKYDEDVWKAWWKSAVTIVSLWSFQFRHLWVWDSVLSPKMCLLKCPKIILMTDVKKTFLKIKWEESGWHICSIDKCVTTNEGLKPSQLKNSQFCC